MTILLKDIILDGSKTNVLIADNLFADLNAADNCPAEQVIDCSAKILTPAFYNGHCHAPMALLRGYADDMELHRWLTEFIWPTEAKLSYNDILVGSKLAILEMIRSGTVFFNDMYWQQQATIDAAKEIGIRMANGDLYLDAFDQKPFASKRDSYLDLVKQQASNPLFTAILTVHSVYGTTKQALLEVATLAKELNLPLNIHLAETEKEVADCLQNTGMHPVQYLDSLGLLGPDTFASHVIHLGQKEADILKARQVKIIHNPISNMKLASGCFKSELFDDYLDNILLGTDGCSSNNNLSMLEEMKFAALLAKLKRKDPTVFSAETVYKFATVNPAKAFGLNAGEIALGNLADCLILKADNPLLVPNYNLHSNLVYSADSSIIDSVICNGKFLMQNGWIENEIEIIEEAKAIALKLKTKN